MDEKKRVFILMAILAATSLVIAGITIAMLYHTAFEQQREVLVSTAQSQARLIESILSFELTNESAAEAEEATLRHVLEAHQKFKGIGETGEFTFAKREGNSIVFLLSHRHLDFDKPKPVPIDSKLAEPMRLALSGLSGSIIGLDYRGERVLAAYEPLAGLKYGIVAKIDLSEIRAPFVETGKSVLIIAVLLVSAGVLMFVWITDPIIDRIKRHSKHLSELVESLQQSQKELKQANDGMEQRVKDRTSELTAANEQLLEEGQKRARVEARLWALWKLTRMADFEEQELCSHILNSAIKFTKSASAFLGFVGPDGSSLDRVYWAADNGNILETAFKDSFVQSDLWLEAVNEDKVIVENDCASDSPVRNPLTEALAPIKRTMIIPIRTTYGIVSILAVFDKDEEYTHEEVRQLEAFTVGAHVILDQREIKRQLVASERKYSALVENSLTGIFISSHGEILFVNQRFAEFNGFSAKELVGMKVEAFIHPEDMEIYRKCEEALFENAHEPRSYSLRWKKKDGEIVWMNISNILFDYNGQRALLWNVNDITEIMLLQEALHKSEQACHLLSQDVLRSQERERKRVAGEIHDSVSQSLAALKFRIEDYSLTALEKTGEHPKELNAVIDMIQNTLKEVSRIMNDLRPAGLDELGILAAIADFCNEFQETYPEIRIASRLDMAERDVPEHIKAPAFRVLQEALRNAAKHSKADRVEIGLQADGGTITLTVKDNGVGLHASRTAGMGKPVGGLGLFSMRERAKLSGGSVAIHSLPGEGTTVEAQWPLDPASFDSGMAVQG